MRDRFIDWSAIDAAFSAMMWILVLVLAAAILAEYIPRSDRIANAHHYQVGR